MGFSLGSRTRCSLEASRTQQTDAPPFELKAVDEANLVNVQQIYDSVHARLEALYPDGETLCFFNRRVALARLPEAQPHVDHARVSSALTLYLPRTLVNRAVLLPEAPRPSWRFLHVFLASSVCTRCTPYVCHEKSMFCRGGWEAQSIKLGTRI